MKISYSFKNLPKREQIEVMKNSLAINQLWTWHFQQEIGF